jgi:hypothetical protein
MAAPTAKLRADANAACRTRSERLGNAKFVAGMRAYRVMGHELIGDLLRQRRIEAASNIDRS